MRFLGQDHPEQPNQLINIEDAELDSDKSMIEDDPDLSQEINTGPSYDSDWSEALNLLSRDSEEI